MILNDGFSAQAPLSREFRFIIKFIYSKKSVAFASDHVPGRSHIFASNFHVLPIVEYVYIFVVTHC